MLPPLVLVVVVAAAAAAAARASQSGVAVTPGSGPGWGCSSPDGTAGSPAEQLLMRRLHGLRGVRLSTVKAVSSEESYTYTFTLCSSVFEGDPTAGLVQTTAGKEGAEGKTTIIGRINATQIIGGSDWVILIYLDGDRYDNHCGKEKRRGMIMISCGPPGTAAFSVVQEEREKGSDCFYLFELDTDTVCPDKPQRISTGSVLVILVLVLTAVYLLGGFIYQRLVVGAKGFDQFPHRQMWQELGNLTADGCDFVFRSSPAPLAPSYRGGAATDPLDEAGDEEERDEHLLPM